MKTFNRFKKLFFVTILFIAIISFFILNQTNSSKVTRTIKVKKENLIQRVTVAGNIEPYKKTIVTAPFNGYIKKMYVKTGQKVKKGDPIVSVVQSLQSPDPTFPLRSPLDGTVVSIQKREGSFVKQDDPKDFILRIDNLESLYILSYVPEVDMIKIKKGDSAIIQASALLNKEYQGVVIDISLAAQDQEKWQRNSKVEYQTQIKILDPDILIKPGMSSIIDIVTKKKENVLAIPHEFILEKEKKHYVFPINGKEKEVKIGLQNESHAEITEGVSEGEELKQIDFLELFSSDNT